MKFSVIMTLYNRPQLQLLNTLVALGNNDWSDGEIVVVDDGSTLPYDPVFESFESKGIDIKRERVNTIEDKDAFHIEGTNNPAYAMNTALDIATGEYIFTMSSDVMCPPHIIDAAFKYDLKNIVWMPCIHNTDRTLSEYTGPNRLCPLGWFYGTHRKHHDAARWDENYLKGIGFEDNDKMGSLAVAAGRFVIDTNWIALHQDHARNTTGHWKQAYRVNRAYTGKKWGYIPWGDNCNLQKSVTNVNGQIVMDVKAPQVIEEPKLVVEA